MSQSLASQQDKHRFIRSIQLKLDTKYSLAEAILCMIL